MSIYKGSNKVIALYKGATPIIKRYRGTYLIYEKGGDTPIEDEDIVLTYSQLDNNNEISFKINNTTYKGSTVNYSATKQELGINSITSVNFSSTYIEKIDAFPSLKNITTAFAMFNYCYSLKEIPKFEYPSYNIDTNQMFAYCNSLTSVTINDLEGLNTNNAQGMFMSCSRLTKVELPTSLTTCDDLSVLFGGCSELTDFYCYVNFAPTSVFNMFTQCSKLTNCNLQYMDWSNITDASGMFNGCKLMGKTQFMRAFGRNKPTNLTNISYMFNNTKLDATNLYGTDVGVYQLFANCKIEYADYLYAYTPTGINGMFSDDMRVFNPNIISVQGMFSNTNNLFDVSIGNYNDYPNLTNMSYMFENSNVGQISFSFNSINPDVDCSGMFNGCYNLQNIYFSETIDCGFVDKITAALEEAGIKDNVTLHSNCGGGETEEEEEVVSTDLVIKYEDGYCGSINFLDSTYNVDSYSEYNEYADYGSGQWESIIPRSETNIDSYGSYNLNRAFRDKSAIRHISINLNPDSWIEDMEYMFDGCSELQTLTLFNFNIDNYPNTNNMFRNTKLKVLYINREGDYQWWRDRLDESSRKQTIIMVYADDVAKVYDRSNSDKFIKINLGGWQLATDWKKYSEEDGRGWLFLQSNANRYIEDKNEDTYDIMKLNFGSYFGENGECPEIVMSNSSEGGCDYTVIGYQGQPIRDEYGNVNIMDNSSDISDTGGEKGTTLCLDNNLEPYYEVGYKKDGSVNDRNDRGYFGIKVQDFYYG